jgi:hypothetical protein
VKTIIFEKVFFERLEKLSVKVYMQKLTGRINVNGSLERKGET